VPTEALPPTAAIVLLVLQADGNLRQPLVLGIDGIAQQARLGAENVLMKPAPCNRLWLKACEAWAAEQGYR
jgi:hypothetical protein